MRVLVGHSPYRQPGGEDRYVDLLVELLSAEHDVARFERRNDDLGSSPRTAGRMLGSPRLVREARDALAAFAPDVVHVHNLYPGIGPALHLAARRAGVPLVMTVHNYRLRCPNGLMYTEDGLCHRCVSGNRGHALLHDCFPTTAQAVAYATVLSAHQWLLPLERMVDAFVAPSEFVADRLRDWGIDASRVHVVPHPMATVPGANTVPGTHGLFLGRMREEKGPDIALAALEQAGDQPFVFAGSGPMQDELQARAHRANLRQVRFVGWQPPDEVQRLIADARYVVMPSRFEEPAGLVALEAMAAGRPVVVSDRGALPELAETGAALVTPADDVPALATTMARLIEDEDLAARMGTAGLTTVAGRHAPDVHARALAEVYGSAAGRGAVSTPGP